MGEAVPCDGEERQGLGSAGLPENWLSLKPINIPMGGGDEVDDGKSGKVIVEARLECNISSKGLGCSEGFKGRMRARLDDQGNRVGRSNKNKTRNLKNGSESGVAENIGGTDQAKCPVCSKGFHSKKAMYGHMRCHPEREWRGINPPPFAKTVSCSSVSQGIDGLSHASMTSTEEGLAVGTSKHAKQVVQKAHKCRTCNKSFPTGQALGGHQTSHRQKPAQLATPRQEALILSKNRNKLDQEIESESLLVAPRESKCSTCHKVFPTLQALGGHRSSHSYKNNLQAMDSALELIELDWNVMAFVHMHCLLKQSTRIRTSTVGWFCWPSIK
ncbi:unnamed protein product, partial [Vitis vinifera]